MDHKEAMAVLGLEEPFSRKDITRAHRQLMGKFHPDKGGNTYLATKLNNARDLLLDKVRKSA
jgi:DnaJ-class molecular chaperone